MAKHSTLLIISLAFFLTLGALMWFASVRDSSSSGSPSTPHLTPSERVSVREYTNQAAGFSFIYPEALTLTSDKIFPGETGQKFTGLLEGNDFEISFGGVTRDYSYPRGASILDTTGYSQWNGVYRFGETKQGFVLHPSEFLPVGGANQALVIRNTELELLLDASSSVAFINLPGPQFPGIALVVTPVGEQGLSDDAIKIFRNIVGSIRFRGSH